MQTQIESDHNEKKEYKTKDYILRAKQKYRNKKYSENEEFREKILAKNREWYHANKDKQKEKRAKYMKEYNARKKLEKQLIKTNNTSDVPIIEALEKLSITSEDNKIQITNNVL